MPYDPSVAYKHDGWVDWYVRGQPIRPKEGDLARLIVLVDGHLPGLLTQL